MAHHYNDCKFLKYNRDMHGKYKERCIHKDRNKLIHHKLMNKIISYIFGESNGCLAEYRFEHKCPLYIDKYH
jgi:hypothetical protein